MTRTSAAGAEAEQAHEAYLTARVRNRRVPELEPVILKCPHFAARYAFHLIKGRWDRAETRIRRNGEAAAWYAAYVIKGRFPEAERIFARDGRHALFYAREALKGPFPLGETAIARDAGSSLLYATVVLKGRFPKGEKLLAADSLFALAYAKEVVKKGWPRGEPAIMTSTCLMERYAVEVLGQQLPPLMHNMILLAVGHDECSRACAERYIDWCEQIERGKALRKKVRRNARAAGTQVAK